TSFSRDWSSDVCSSDLEVLDDLRTLLGTALFEHRAARHDDVAATAIHLEDLEGLRVVHERGDVADRTDVDLRTRQEGDGAVQIRSEERRGAKGTRGRAA